MSLQPSSNLRLNLLTPRKTENRLKAQYSQETPDCFKKVTLETPVARRKTSKDNSYGEINNLIVAVRVRPMNLRELSCVGVTDVIRVRNQELIVRSNPLGNVNVGLDHIFQYDHVFWSCDETSLKYACQEDVFNGLGKPLLSSAFRGYNACLFAYGQTGSGKTYSMMGADPFNINCVINMGIIPRFCRELFQHIAQLDVTCLASVEVSYFEIYNEKIHDLLINNESSSQRVPLKVREHPIWGPYIVNLSSHIVATYEELCKWLIIGNKNRATAATAMNEKSSRSHSIFCIELGLSESTAGTDSSRRSKVNLVDLAGSERLGNSKGNEEKHRQGVSINKSLLTLGKVISSLAEQKKGQQFVPYRDSVLTWLLRVKIPFKYN
jgi:kinesin family member 14